MSKKRIIKASKILSSKELERICFVLIAIFFVFAVLRIWVHPSGGHTHRQSDTIGMSISFAEQVRERGWDALDFLIYPRVLQRGLLDGINASEFPLLNVVCGFGFLLSSNPWVGVFLSSLMILALNLYVAFVYLPKLLRAWNVEVSSSVCLLIWFAGGTLAGQSNVVMPEGIAFPMMILGAVQLLEVNQRLSRFALGILLCSLGIATKPTVILVLGAVVALPLLVHERRTQWKSLLTGCTLSLLFPSWWYVIHAKKILNIAQGPQIFALAGFHPLEKLQEVGFKNILWLMWREPQQGQFPMFFGWFFIAAAIALGEWVPVVLYLLSLIVAVSLDGAHIYAHYYYFIGTSIFSILLMARILGAAQDRGGYLKTLIVILLGWGVVYNVRSNIWVWGVDYRHGQAMWNLGAQARKIINPSDHLITDDDMYPYKMLLMGRSGTAANSHVYQICNRPQFAERPLAIVSETPPPEVPPLCSGRPHEFKSIEINSSKWYVTLIR